MIFNNLADIKLGDVQVSKVMLGEHTVWQKNSGNAVQVEYIQSDGDKGYIGTGVFPDANTKIVMDCVWLEETGSAYIGDSTDGDNNDFRIFYINSLIYADIGSARDCYSTDYALNTRLHIVFGADGVRITNSNNFLDISLAGNSNFTGTSGDIKIFDSGHMKLYGFQIYDGDELIRDLAPAVMNGQAGLLDKHTRTFYPPVPESQFIAAPHDTIKIDILQNIINGAEYSAKTMMVGSNNMQDKYTNDVTVENGKITFKSPTSGYNDFIFYRNEVFLNRAVQMHIKIKRTENFYGYPQTYYGTAETFTEYRTRLKEFDLRVIGEDIELDIDIDSQSASTANYVFCELVDGTFEILEWYVLIKKQEDKQ